MVTVSGNPNPTNPTTKYRCEFVADYKMRKCEIAKVNMCKQRKWDNAKVVRKCV